MGKASFVLLFITITLSSFCAVAFTKAGNHSSETQTQSGKSCIIPFSKLDYVQQSFEGPAICVDAKTDAQALFACSETKYKRVINPANRQYGQGSAERGENPEGYYYCVKDIPANRKQSVCETSSTKENLSKYNFYWDAPKGKTDGDCRCAAKPISAKVSGLSCAQDLPEDPCKKINLATDEASTNDPFAAYFYCKCGGADTRSFPSNEAVAKCASKPEPAPAPAPAPAPGPGPKPPVKPVATEPEQKLRECVDKYLELSRDCKTASETAKKSCDPKQTKEDKESAAAIKAANDIYTAPMAGKGMQAECFTSGLVTNGGKVALKSMSDSCESGSDACKLKCDEDKYQEFSNECTPLITAGAQEDSQSEYPVADDSSPNRNYYNSKANEISTNFTAGTKLCKTEVKEGQSLISGLLSGLGDALASSLRCMCQTSSGAGDCAALVTPAACDINPTAIGCSAYGAIAVCTPGGGYDAKLCSCQLNPKEMGCPGGAASGGLSNFASPSIKSNGINDGAAPTTIAGGLKAAGAFPDLPRGTNDDGSSDGTPMTLGASPSSGPGGGGGGGIGGGGGASGGGEPPAAAGEPAAEEKGIGGLFNQAKTFFKDALRARKTPTAATKNGKSEKGFDPNKLRPKRGLASKNGIGSKNQDIWKMSNSCMYAETCPRNMNSFLEAPLKQK